METNQEANANVLGEGKQDQATTGVTIYKDRPAGFWMRFWAFLADLLIVFSINGILLSPLKLISGGESLTISAWTWKGILGGIVFYLYFLLMTKYFNQTMGKMIFGLR